MGVKEPGTPPPVTVTRAECSSFAALGNLSEAWFVATATTHPQHLFASSSIAPGSSGSETAAPGVSGGRPGRVDFGDVLSLPHGLDWDEPS